MNENIIQGKWKELKGAIKSQWGRLTDDDLTEINGDRERLSGKIQKTYGLAQEEVEKQLKDWEKNNAA